MKTEKTNGTQYEKVPTDENGKLNQPPPKYGYGVRHIQSLLIFSCLCITFIARAHLSVTIVAMSEIPKETTIEHHLDTNSIRNNACNEALQFNNTSCSYNSIENEQNLAVIANGTLSTVDLKSATNNTEKVLGSTNDTISDKDLDDIASTTEIIIKKDGFEDTVVNNVAQSTLNDTSSLINSNVTNEKLVNETNNSNEEETDHSIWNVYRKYKWTKATQEMVLGSFFLGYMIMMSPMGLVVQRWGGKLPLQISLTVTGIITFATPWLAAWGGWKAVCASRVCVGFAQSGTFPSIHTLVAKWIPISERARLGSYIYTGSMIGAVLAFQVGGALAASSLGWPSTFWATGCLCLIMAGLFTIFGAPSPQVHKTVSDEERNYIMGRVYTGVEKRPKTPWKAILTSKPVWACFATQVGTSVIYIFLFTQTPTYLRYILNIDIKSSGMLTSLPYFGNFVASCILGTASDYCTNKGILTLKQARIISNIIASVFPAMCLAGLSFTSNTVLAVSLLILALSALAGVHTGWMVNFIDMSPNFSGTLMATGNTLTNVMAVILPIFVSNIVTDVRDAHQWRIVMFSVATLALICNFIYVFFMTAETQPWNDPEYNARKEEDAENSEKLPEKEKQ